MPILVPGLAFLLALVLPALAWWLPNRPMPLEHPFTGVLESVSFAPYRGLQSPLTGDFPSPRQIADGVQALAGKTRSLRLYSAREGMDGVPAVAGRLGMKVFAGAWISGEDDDNRKEIEALVAMANRYPDVVDRVIVGNEVLLRGDQPVDRLTAYLRQVRAAVKQPVTYADVWEFWLAHPELGAEVDFITVHILPYWENDPLAVEDGNGHVDDILAQLKAVFPGKPIVIGEVGWPTRGRSRDGAVPGRWEAATFLSNFLTKAQAEGLHYNVIEAFDQPWKSKLEGVVGANWGVEDADWTPKLDLAGPVVEEPWWPLGAAAAALLALGVALSGRRHLKGLSLDRAVLAGLVLALGAYTATRAGFEAWFFGYMVWPRLFAWAKAALALGLAVAVARTALKILGRDELAAGPGPRLAAGAWILGTVAGLALLQSVLLVCDGRYRDFQTPYMALAAFGPPALAACAAWTGRERFSERLAFFRLFGPRRGDAGGWQARLQLAIAIFFILCAFGLVAMETPDNVEACLWAGQLLLMALPFLSGFAHRLPEAPAPTRPSGS